MKTASEICLAEFKEFKSKWDEMNAETPTVPHFHSSDLMKHMPAMASLLGDAIIAKRLEDLIDSVDRLTKEVAKISDVTQTGVISR